MKPSLQWYGLKMRNEDKKKKLWLGVDYLNKESSFIKIVYRSSAAEKAGLSAGDEIIAIDDHQFTRARLENILKSYQEDQHVSLLFARRGRILTANIKLERQPELATEIQKEKKKKTSKKQKHNFKLLVKNQE